MNLTSARSIKLLFVGIVAFFLILAVNFMYKRSELGYKIRFDNSFDLRWLFVDSVQLDMNYYSHSYLNSNNIIRRIRFEGSELNQKGYFIDVWRFDNNGGSFLNVKKGDNYENLSIPEYQILDDETRNKLYVSYGFDMLGSNRLEIYGRDSILWSNEKGPCKIWYGIMRDIYVYNTSQRKYEAILTNDFDCDKVLLINFNLEKNGYLVVVKSNDSLDVNFLNKMNLCSSTKKKLDEFFL